MTLTYDLRDRLLQKTTRWNGGPSVALNYLYDANGNLSNLWSSTSGGVTNVYQYDPLNRLTNVLANGSTAAYGYDLAGNLRALRYGDGVTNQYQYDSLNRLTNLTWGNASTLASFSYRLGLIGNRTNLNETVGGTNRIYSWQYDNVYRLTNESAGVTAPTGNLFYQYDIVGNRTNRTAGLGLAAQSWAYNTNDWLTNTDKYDNNGSTTNSGGNWYQYDVMNHVTNANVSSVQIFLTYDGDGNRASKTVGGTTTYYLVDDENPSGYAQVLEEYQGSTLKKVYNYGLSLISQRQPGVSTNYFIADGHGSTRMLTDIGGNTVNVMAYDAYGNLIASSGVLQTAYLYSGQQYDSDLGLYYNRARYLNTGTGRFWTMDSTEGDNEDPLSLHKYLYAEDNPVNNSDPLGLYSQSFGYLAHDAIEQIYAKDHSGDALLPFGSTTGLGGALNPLSRLKPDIFNLTKKRWAEIKPLSQSGLARAVIQYGAYSGFDLFGYYPDAGWQPSTHEALAGSDPIVFFNAGGIMFYTDAVSNLKDLLALTTIQAARQYFLANQAVIARGLIESLARARTLATLAVPASEADAGVGIGTAEATAALGGGAIP